MAEMGSYDNAHITVRLRYPVRLCPPVALWAANDTTFFDPVVMTLTKATGESKPRVKLSGWKIKKDGSQGLSHHTRDFYSSEELPEWLAALVEQAKPDFERWDFSNGS